MVLSQKTNVGIQVSVDIRLMSSSGWDSSQWIGNIAEGIIPGQILTQLFDHAEAIKASAWGKMRKAFQVFQLDSLRCHKVFQTSLGLFRPYLSKG